MNILIADESDIRPKAQDWIPSKLLKMERKYAIYLSPDYEQSQRSYPVLYLLHGAGDDQTGWIQFGEVLNITDKAIREGNATPMIIVMPDANITRRGYFDGIKGDWPYDRFFFEDLDAQETDPAGLVLYCFKNQLVKIQD